MRSIHKKHVGVLLAGVALAALSTPAFADQRDDRINALEQKLEAALNEIKSLRQEQAAEKADNDILANQVGDLKRGQAAQYSDQQTQRGADIKVTLNNARPTFSSPDGRFTFSLRSLLQFDSAYIAQDNRAKSASDLSSGANFRRARIGFEGKAFGDWFYSFLYDLGGSGTEGARLSDAYIQYDGFAPFHFRVGAFATPSGLEDQTGTGDLIFLERAGPSDLGRGIAGSDGRKNFLGVFANGDDYYASIAWSGARAGDAAVFDGQQAAVGRLAYRVYKDADTNVVLSAGGSYVFKVADTAAGPAGPSAITLQEGPENAVDATRLITTGGINAHRAATWNIEGAANWKSVYAQGGYFGYSIDRRASTLPNPDFDGWYVQGTWVLTGESRSYNAGTATFGAPRAAKPFSLKNGDLGAVELAARYSVVDLNYRQGVLGANVVAGSGGIRGGKQEGYTVGINWYPNPVIRLIVDYQHLDINRLSTAAPFQQLGQKVDIATARAQLAF